MRERKGGHSCLPLDEARRGVFMRFESKRATIYTTQERMGSGEKVSKKIQVECPAGDIARRRMRKGSGDQIKRMSEWHVKA